MEAIKLVRELFGFNPEVSDQDMILLIYKDFIEMKTELQLRKAKDRMNEVISKSKVTQPNKVEAQAAEVAKNVMLLKDKGNNGQV